MDWLKKRKRKDFMDAFVKGIEDEVVAHVWRDTPSEYKSWLINYIAIQLQQYETEVLKRPVLDDKWREQYAERIIDEYYLNNDLIFKNEIIRFTKFLFFAYDFMADFIASSKGCVN